MCVCVGGGGGSGYLGMGVRVSILKPTPITYPAFEKAQPIHIFDFTESRPIYILVFEFIFPFISSVVVGGGGLGVIVVGVCESVI